MMHPWIGPGSLAVSLSLLVSSNAFGYCRTTTCEPSWSCAEYPEDCCIRDENGCDINGKPVIWPSSCVSFAIQKDGSTKRNITADELEALVLEAFSSWTSTACLGGTTPSIRVDNFGRAECGVSEYNSCTANANVWMFRDANWSGQQAGGGSDGFDSSALAVTTVNFAVSSAQLYDADVELNSDQAEFTMPNEPPKIDLKSIITHEAGHFLGLDHSPLEDATMYYSYQPGDVGARTLDSDDQKAICDVYTTAREKPAGDSCSPRRGYSTECHPEDDDVEGGNCNGIGESGGCQVAERRAAPSGLGLLMAFAGALGLGGRLSRRRSHPRAT